MNKVDVIDKNLEKKKLDEIIDKESTPSTSYVIIYVILFILVLLSLIGYFYYMR